MKGEKVSLGTRLVEGILQLHGRLPLAYHRWWARRVAWLLGSVLHYRRDVVITNLSRSFPRKSYEQIQEIARRFYLHLSTVFTEMIWFGACKDEKGRKRFVKSGIFRMTNPEEMNRILDASKQTMLLQCHTGNWELIGGIIQTSVNPPLHMEASAISVTYRPLSSRMWDTIMHHNRIGLVRDQGFDGYLATDNVLRFVLGNKDRKYTYVFITDQHPYTGNGAAEVTFMHQKTGTVTAAAHLACKLDMAVAYLRITEREEGGYDVTAVPITDHAAGQDPVKIMEKYYRLLEEDLEKQPWNYLWSHKRWKVY